MVVLLQKVTVIYNVYVTKYLKVKQIAGKFSSHLIMNLKNN